MERPTTMPLKEFLIKKLALSSLIPESTIKAVIDFQCTEGFKATAEKNSIEFSGFGKLVFNRDKALKRMEMYVNAHALYVKELETDLSPTKRRNYEKRLASVIKDMEFLRIKLREDEIRRDI